MLSPLPKTLFLSDSRLYEMTRRDGAEADMPMKALSAGLELRLDLMTINAHLELKRLLEWSVLIILAGSFKWKAFSPIVGRGLLSIAFSLLLSSCCIFGFETRSEYEWQASFPEDTQYLKRQCESEVQDQAALAKKHFELMVARECAKTEPFASVQFVNPSTGGNYGSSIAASTAEALCPDWLQHNAVFESNLWSYCRQCFVSQNEIEMCFEKNGMQRVKVQSIGCKPMRLF